VWDNHFEEKAMENNELYLSIIRSLAEKNEGEGEWFEFKMNNADPMMIGEDVSALSNMARIRGMDKAYLIWGVEDRTHERLGSHFDPWVSKKGNEDLIPWLRLELSPTIQFAFHFAEDGDKRFVVLQIDAAQELPTRFAGNAYCRLESYTKDIRSQPQIERQLLLALMLRQGENDIALGGLSEEELFSYLDFPAYYKAFGFIVPVTREEMIKAFLREGFIQRSSGGDYAISNLGALTFASDLRRFPNLGARLVRVGERKNGVATQIVNPKDFVEGYAISFAKILEYVLSLTKPEERVDETGHTVVDALYPPILVREALTNMMIHQDISVSGESLMVWVSEKSLSFSNPGSLDVPVDRIIDIAPKARNEKLAAFLRRLGIGDSQGSGFDKIESALEEKRMPSAVIYAVSDSVRLEIEAKTSYADYSEEERIRSVYYCACLCHENRVTMDNDFLRKRFGLSEKERPLISRLLGRCVELGRIKLADPNVGVRNRSYVPYWA
jgi:ATP-dependent DNA helicase RecG